MFNFVNNTETSVVVDNEDFIITYKFLEKAIEFKIIDAIALKLAAAYAYNTYIDYTEFNLLDSDTLLTIYEAFCSDDARDGTKVHRIGYNMIGTGYDLNAIVNGLFDFNTLAYRIFGSCWKDLNITFVDIMYKSGVMLYVPLGGSKKMLQVNTETLDNHDDRTFEFINGQREHLIPEDKQELLDKCNLKYSLMGSYTKHVYIDGFYSLNLYQKQLNSKVISKCKISRNLEDKNIKALSDVVISGDKTDKRLKVNLDMVNFMNFTRFYNADVDIKWVNGMTAIAANCIIKIGTVGDLRLEKCNNCVVVIEDELLHNIQLIQCKNTVVIFKKPLSNSLARRVMDNKNFKGSEDIAVIFDFDKVSSIATLDNSYGLNNMRNLCKIYASRIDEKMLGYGGFRSTNKMDAFYKKYKNFDYLREIQDILSGDQYD